MSCATADSRVTEKYKGSRMQLQQQQQEVWQSWHLNWMLRGLRVGSAAARSSLIAASEEGGGGVDMGAASCWNRPTSRQTMSQHDAANRREALMSAPESPSSAAPICWSANTTWNGSCCSLTRPSSEASWSLSRAWLHGTFTDPQAAAPEPRSAHAAS